MEMHRGLNGFAYRSLTFFQQENWQSLYICNSQDYARHLQWWTCQGGDLAISDNFPGFWGWPWYTDINVRQCLNYALQKSLYHSIADELATKSEWRIRGTPKAKSWSLLSAALSLFSHSLDTTCSNVLTLTSGRKQHYIQSGRWWCQWDQSILG